ncbi:MAG: zinc metallopeptidase [Arenicellales bacterium]|nr:zinc metallopeptidase [Arenicellales bacterium]
MHPVLIIIPAVALIFGPRLWVKHVLKRYNQDDLNSSGSASQVARALLDNNGLQNVKVECTDIGDHYDPDAKSVRLARDKFDRKSLTAVTTAAHEVGHALQHATEYTPFIWRGHLVKAARVVGEVGSVVLISVPIAALATRNPVPAPLIGIAVLAILGSVMAVQLVTLPTEFDASFNKATQMLKAGYIDEDQLGNARKILVACSLTYVASSLTSVLNIWPWLPRGLTLVTGNNALVATQGSSTTVRNIRKQKPSLTIKKTRHRSRRQRKPSMGITVFKKIGKPLVRNWLKLSRSYTAHVHV